MRLEPSVEDTDREDGFTLVEFLVAMLIFSILSTLVLAISARFFSTSTSASQVFNNTSTAETVMDRLTKEIRAAVYEGTSPPSPIISASPTSLSFYAALGGVNGPTKVVLSLSNNTVTESDYAAISGSSPTWSYSATPATTVISAYVVNPSSTPLFTYYQSSGALTSPQTLSGAANTVAIATIQINLVVQQGSGANAATLSDTVPLLNVDYNAS